jgi:CheY-like chemotaxis protein
MEKNSILKILFIYSSNGHKLVKDFFENYSFQLDFAEDSESVVKKIQAKEYDIVFIDFQALNMDNSLIVEKIRNLEEENGRKGAVPIIFILGSENEDSKKKGFELGCDAYLAKPFCENKLLETIKLLTGFQVNKASGKEIDSVLYDDFSRKGIVVAKIDIEIKDLIPGFMEENKTNCQHILDSLTQKKFDIIKKIGHSMKGAGTGYGFKYVSLIGKNIELAAANKNAEIIQKAVTEFSEYLNTVQIIYE